MTAPVTVNADVNPDVSDVTATISRLLVYPVKSCAPVALDEVILTETGLEFDRAWMVVDAQGEYVTQRELPRMALIQPKMRHADMVLRAPGMLALHISLNEVEEPATVRLWGEEVKAWDMGAVAAQWFSDFLGKKVRMVRFDPEVRRLSSMKWTGGVEALNQFSDGYAVLVTSEASLDGLNSRLQAAGHKAVVMERFRPNIVLAGIEAHDEDRLDVMRIEGESEQMRLKAVKPCARCPIPNVDPATGTSSPEVGDMLQTYRKNDILKGAPSFGMNAIVLSGAEQTLKVGQAVKADWNF